MIIHVALFAVLCCTARDPAQGQVPVITWLSDSGDEYGASVARVGDVDGDGRSEYAVADPKTIGEQVGRVLLYSGVDGALIHEFTAEGERDGFGISVAGVGDLDGDGTPEIAIGALNYHAYLENGTRGYARVYSGDDGEVLYEFDGADTHDLYGWRVGAAGDVDADGGPDFFVAAPGISRDGTKVGHVDVYRGSDGSRVHRLESGQRSDGFGWAVGSPGDVDGDGHADILVSAPLGCAIDAFGGSLYLFSGGTGEVLARRSGESGAEGFGASMCVVESLAADEVPDVICTSGWSRETPYGTLTRYSAGTLERVGEPISGTAGFHLGGPVQAGPDVNGDGVDDLMVGDPWTNSLRLISGSLPFQQLEALEIGCPDQPVLFGAAFSAPFRVADGAPLVALIGGKTIPAGTIDPVGRAFLVSLQDGAVLLEFQPH